MANTTKPSKAINILLWVGQILLATSLFYGGAMKLFQPIEQLSAMWPWTGDIPLLLVKLSGIVDWLGALGVVLPTLLRIKPQLTAVAAIGVVLLMTCASIFHISRGEAAQIGFNVFLALIAAFVAWGRFQKK